MTIRKYSDKGFVIELDIQLFSDGVAMVFHDADLERVCGVEGKIWEYTAAELKEMKLPGTEEYDGKALYLVLTYMLTNVATRPDFISYKAIHKDNISLNVCRMLGAKTVCYTLKSPEEFAYVNGDFDMYIFDSFDLSQYR